MIQDIPFKVIKGRLNDSAESAFTYYYEPIIRKSDTANFLLQNNQWKIFEPKGSTPSEPLKTYLESHGHIANVRPLDAMVRGAMVGNSFFCGVMIVYLILSKIFLART